MKFKTLIAILLTCTAAGFAQEHLADTLRNGILEEDGKQNPGAAIQQYQAVMTQFDTARQTAATALFRMAECYRKQAKKQPAIAAYQRLLKDFPDQTKLAAQSRSLLATAYSVAPAESQAAVNLNVQTNVENGRESQKQQQALVDNARGRYRNTIVEEMMLDESQLNGLREKAGVDIDTNPAIVALQEKVLHLKRDLAAFDAGMTPPAK